MKVTYRGPFREPIEVYDAATNTNHGFEHGEAVDVPDELGQRLIDQAPGDWQSEDYDPAPAHSATKAEWVDYRAAQGHDVDGLTKEQLIELPDVPAEEG